MWERVDIKRMRCVGLAGGVVLEIQRGVVEGILPVLPTGVGCPVNETFIYPVIYHFVFTKNIEFYWIV